MAQGSVGSHLMLNLIADIPVRDNPPVGLIFN